MAKNTPRNDGPRPDGEPVVGDTRDAERAIDSIEEAVGKVRAAATDDAPADAPVEGPGGEEGRMELPDFAAPGAPGETPAGMALLNDVALQVKIELGRTRMYVEDVLRLNADAVIELDKAAGDPVDIYVNDRHVARGEVLVLNENFCVRVSEILEAGPA